MVIVRRWVFWRNCQTGVQDLSCCFPKVILPPIIVRGAFLFFVELVIHKNGQCFNCFFGVWAGGLNLNLGAN